MSRTSHHLIVDLMNQGLTDSDAADIAGECFADADDPIARLEKLHADAEEGLRIETKRTYALRQVLDAWRRDKSLA